MAALVLCAPPALAQGDDPGELSRIADELQAIKSHVESINASSTLAFLGSFLGSMAIALIAVWATIKYARKLDENTRQIEQQVTQSEEHLELARDDARNRLRPTLAWGVFGDGSPIRISGWSERPSGLTIRLLNVGQVSARDIIMYRDARAVEDDGKPGVPGHKLRRLGALGPGRSIDILIPVPVETLGRVLSGGLAYIEAWFSYRAGDRQRFQYRVGGYVSNAISTLFDVAGQETVPGGRAPSAASGAGAAARRAAPHRGPAPPQGGKGGQHEDGGEPEPPLPDLGQCRRDVEADPKSATARRAMGSALHRAGRHVEALEELDAAMELDPVDGRTIKELSRVLGSLGRYSDAIGQLRRISARGHRDVCVERELVRLHTMLGNHQGAHDALSRLDELDPSFETCMSTAAASAVMRQYDMAVHEFRRAVGMRPDDAGAHFGLGVAQMNSGHREEALVTLRRAIEIKPKMADAHVCLAHALYGLGLEEAACEAFDRAVGEGPESRRAHVSRGIIMLELGRNGEARESFAAVRRLDPSLQVPQVGGTAGHADP